MPAHITEFAYSLDTSLFPGLRRLRPLCHTGSQVAFPHRLHCFGLMILALSPVSAETLIDVRFPSTRLNHEHTSLNADPFLISHFHSSAQPKLRTALGNGWRHSFDMLLTVEGDERTVFDARGASHEFRRQAHVNKEAVNYNSSPSDRSGSLSRIEDQHHWTRADGVIVEFTGSLPTRITYPDQSFQLLNYRKGQLLSVDLYPATTPPHRLIDFNYDEHVLKQIRTTGQPWHDYVFDIDGQLSLHPAPGAHARTFEQPTIDVPLQNAESMECDADETIEQTCDTEQNSPPADFLSSSRMPGALRIDIRPSSCQSYFTDFYGTVRGEQIEEALKRHPRYQSLDETVRSFPIVDFIEDGTVRVVRSRDLGSKTLSSTIGEPLFDRLIRDGRDIERKLLEPLAELGTLTVTENARSTTISHDEINRIVLEVIVRYDLASTSQIAQIEKARQRLLTDFGVELQIIEIP